jgi:twitching motility protein PilT
MNIETLVTSAREQGASDLHLEPGLPPALRIRGALKSGSEPIAPGILSQMAQSLIGPEHWDRFLERRSFDLSRTIARVRCRVNIMATSRGVGMAIRLLSSFQATVDKLNLLPDLRKLVAHTNGLIIVSGPTGCGKSSTLAAFVQEINLSEARHVVTIESPIEYTFRPRLAYIRQREVGRDTPSFEQALLDAMREDPDVLMVGEMRDPETMRLTLNASETGHLVLTTIHSSTCVEALQRLISAFPAEIQSSVRAQLADCLVAVVSQRLKFRPDLGIRVPECEILINNHAIRNFIRSGDLFKIISSIETGAEQGMWTFTRYQQWLEGRKNFHLPDTTDQPESEVESAPSLPAPHSPARSTSSSKVSVAPGTGRERPATTADSGPIDIEPVEGGLNEVIRKLAP